MKKLLVAIDQGTTSTRAILFDVKGNVKFISQFEFKQYFPKNGWVEHDPDEIWLKTKKTLIDVINKAKKLKGKVLTIGITNQRETTILWNKKNIQLDFWSLLYLHLTFLNIYYQKFYYIVQLQN